MNLTEHIAAYARQSPEGAPLTAKAFLHLGKRAAVDQALARLAKRGELTRLTRGVYARPVRGKFGVRPPQPHKVIEAFAAHMGETLAPAETASANALGLTTQVPVRQVFLTSGPSRVLRLGKQSVELRHAPDWKLARGPMGHAIRAISWAGKARASSVAKEIMEKLPKGELRHAEAAVQKMPSWLAKEISAMQEAHA